MYLGHHPPLSLSSLARSWIRRQTPRIRVSTPMWDASIESSLLTFCTMMSPNWIQTCILSNTTKKNDDCGSECFELLYVTGAAFWETACDGSSLYEHQFKCDSLYFWSDFLLMHLGWQWKMSRVLWPQIPCSCLWPDHCDHLGSEEAAERLTLSHILSRLCVSASVSLCSCAIQWGKSCMWIGPPGMLLSKQRTRQTLCPQVCV